MKLEEFVAESAEQHRELALIRSEVVDGLHGFCDHFYDLQANIDNGDQAAEVRRSTEARRMCDSILFWVERYERLEGDLDFFERVLLNRIVPLDEGDQTRSEFLVKDLSDDAIIETAFGLARVTETYPCGEYDPEAVRIKVEMLGEHVYSQSGQIVEFDLLRYQLVRVVNNQQ